MLRWVLFLLCWICKQLISEGKMTMNAEQKQVCFTIRPLRAGDREAFIPLKIDNSGYSYDRIQEFSDTMWETMLASGDQRMVYFEDGQLAGIASIERQEEGIHLSYYLRPEYRGKGYGTILVQALIRQASEQYPDKKIYIRIRNGNIPSICAAERAGAVLERYENAATYEIFLSGLEDIEKEEKDTGEDAENPVIDELKQGIEMARDAVRVYTVPVASPVG